MKLVAPKLVSVVAGLAVGLQAWGVDADDSEAWRAAASLSPLASSALGLIMHLHYEYWCTEFLPYMPTPGQYVETTVTATVTGATTTTTITTTTTTTAAAGGVGARSAEELPALLAQFGTRAVAEACTAVFRPGPRATTTTVVVGGRAATATVTVTETVTGV